MEEEMDRRGLEQLADALGVSVDFLSETDWEILENSSDDGLVYSYSVVFDPSSPPHMLDQLTGFDHSSHSVDISPNTFDAPEPDLD